MSAGTVEWVDPSTGEVQQYDVDSFMSEAELTLRDDPNNPFLIEQAIQHLGDLLLKAGAIEEQLWAERYAAESVLAEAHARAMLTSNQQAVSLKKKDADLATMELRRKADDAKAILHGFQAKAKALSAKHFGMMNVNKRNHQGMQTFGRNLT